MFFFNYFFFFLRVGEFFLPCTVRLCIIVCSHTRAFPCVFPQGASPILQLLKFARAYHKHVYSICVHSRRSRRLVFSNAR